MCAQYVACVGVCDECMCVCVRMCVFVCGKKVCVRVCVRTSLHVHDSVVRLCMYMCKAYMCKCVARDSKWGEWVCVFVTLCMVSVF